MFEPILQARHSCSYKDVLSGAHQYHSITGIFSQSANEMEYTFTSLEFTVFRDNCVEEKEVKLIVQNSRPPVIKIHILRASAGSSSLCLFTRSTTQPEAGSVALVERDILWFAGK